MSGMADIRKVLDTIPARRERTKPDLFSISGHAHYEDVLSNWYKYLFDPTADHGLGHAFLHALYKLAGRTMPFRNGVHVEREWSTPEGKAIDLVIHDGVRQGRKLKADHALIIENKVYHWLANDLGIYWNVALNQEADRLGVVLSLNPITIDHPRFINITHHRLLGAVFSDLGATMPDRTKIYLNDLRSNLDRLTQNMAYNDRVGFYLNNASAINEAIALRNETRQYLTSELSIVARNLGGMKLQNWADKYWYIYRTDADRVYYTILLDEMLDKGDALHVMIELNGVDKQRIDELEWAYAHLLGEALVAGRPYREGKDWVQYTGIRIPISPEERGRLADVVTTAVKTHLQELFAAIAAIENVQQPGHS